MPTDRAPHSASPGRRACSVLLLVLAALAGTAAAAPGSATDAAQRAYLQAHPAIPLCVDPDWWPFETLDKSGRHVGIAADLIALVSARSGVRFAVQATASWEDSLAATRAGDCRALSFLNDTPERRQWLLFTAPLLSDPNVIITREEHPPVADLHALRGQSIALPVGTAMAEFIARDYPDLRIVPTDSEREALRLVSERQVDMTLRSLIVAAATIKHEGWFNLKIAGQVPGYDNQLRMAVLQADAPLRDLLDKGIATLSEAERRQVVDRHLALQVVTAPRSDYRLVAAVVLGLVALLAGGLLGLARLRTLNRQLRSQAQTDALTGLPNRHALDAGFAEAVQHALRQGRPLAAILFDIDFFKRVNDDFGHLTGDRVLIAFGSVLRDGLRAGDSLCRWGGEEFLVVCRDSDAAQARQLAERLLQRVREHAFPGPRQLTASAGVAVLRAGDDVASLVQRADEALYDAKHAGRDRVGPCQGACAAPGERVESL